METNTFTQEIQEGERLFQEGKIEEALVIFESIVEKQPDNLFALNDKGVSLNGLGRYNEAIETFIRILGKDGNNSTAAFNLIFNYFAAKKWEDADNALKKYGQCLSQPDIQAIFDELKKNLPEEIPSDSEDNKLLTVSIDNNGRETGFKIRLDISQHAQKIMWNYLSKGQHYEPETSQFFSSILEQGDCVIDIGAHIGYFSLLAATLVGPSGKVISFEPENSNYRHLRLNMQLNNLLNCHTFNLPLGSRVENKTFYINSDADGGHALWDVGLHPLNEKSRRDRLTKQLQVHTLDSLFGDNSLGSLKLIKIDAEGAEQAILEGGLDTIKINSVPYIICEVNRFGLEQMGSNEDGLRGLLKNAGYESYLLTCNQKGPAAIKLEEDYTLKTEYVFNLLFALKGIELPVHLLNNSR